MLSVREKYWRYSLFVLIAGLGLTIFAELTPFLGGLLGAVTIYVLLRRQMWFLSERRRWRRSLAAALLLGDIVWDSPELFAGVREQFASLGIPVYGVIGNHDHDRNKYTDREATENYRNHFGPTYYAFDMGRTH